MPTERDIREARDILEGSLGAGIEVLGLYGRMANAEQQRIFSPSDRRRVILATNIAETSITLPRIRTVVDTGLARISRYNPRTRTKRLPVEEISQSSANQRAGRAGRVQAGTCIRLYDEEDYLKRPQYSQPEIQRANLAEVILRMKAFCLGHIEDFPFIDAPRPQSIRAGYQLLHELGALDDTHELTPMGRELARLPLDPSLGRMLIQARTEGALPEMLVIAAALSIPDPRERPEQEREQAAAAHKAFSDNDSDFMSLLRIWRAAPEERGSRNALRKFCKSNYLSLTRMREWRDLHKQLADAMEDIAPQRRKELASTTEKQPVAPSAKPAPFNLYNALHRSILSGLLGQIAMKKERNDYQASANRVATIFPGSNLFERKEKQRRGRNVEATPDKTPTAKASPSESNTSAAPADSGWIMAAEIVQTSQLFARTVARIDPVWVVDIGEHLCKFSYLDPHWSARAGRVLVTERALIYGMEVRKRQVDYGRVNRAEATELFIRGALINDPASRGDSGAASFAPGERQAARNAGAGAAPLRIQHKFFTHNRKLRESIDSVLTRVRSNRMHDVDEALYRFYSERIEGVSSIHDLNTLMRSKLTENPDFLCAAEEDLLDKTDAAYDQQLFPDSISLGHTVLPLRYAYTPGNEEDGVTLRVPLPVADKLSAGQIQWIVPGLREEQISTLLRALPKSKRVALMPIEPKVAETAARFQPGHGDFLRELATYLTRTYRVAIEASDWTPDSLPPHLRPRVEVIDQRNRTVASGRDIETIRERASKVEVKSSAWDRAVSKWERYALTSWSFGDLPESIVVEHIAGSPLLAWPGLSARAGEGENQPMEVDLRLYRSRDEAERESRAGIRRLAEVVLARDLAWLAKSLETWAKKQVATAGTRHVPGNKQHAGLQGLQGLGALQASWSKAGTVVTGTATKGASSATLVRSDNAKLSAATTSATAPADILSRSALQHICASSLVLSPTHPLTAQRFEAMLTAAKQNFPVWVSSITAATEKLLAQRDAILSFPKRYSGMEEDIERLAGLDFLSRTPHSQLPHLQRYLKAVQVRAERASLNPAKDADKARPLEPFANKEAQVPEARRQAFRWMLEEFRVSLFAPELGTAYPVSPQRLKALMDGTSG
ncbi:ATP-dependent RNA helicase HrpA [Verrucomicrobia bacterium LW23]|nr:ATP-dependent RNA helicase HrpA [Verrucomicrobia bacterium LW23]